MSLNIDKEWENFISSGFEDDISSDEEEVEKGVNKSDNFVSADISTDFDFVKPPKASDIYISTKTKIAYLSMPIELKYIFWNIPVIPYATPCNGVIKKQMKFNSDNIEDVNIIQNHLKQSTYYEENIITSINNPTGRIKFKDIRKVSIGISKKDIMSYRSKKKSAFYNCFVLIFRMKMNSSFKEYHVKIFNTGKLEIPGIQSEESFKIILQQIVETLQPHIKETLFYKDNTNETVLINSNFNCGFFINREALYDILKFKYNIHTIFDPCSYPGIQCKFYYNPDVSIQSGSQISEEHKKLYTNITGVSFMIFRTGSVLIVGKCDESVLFAIYEFLKVLLIQEFSQIRQKNTKIIDNNVTSTKEKRKKIRRKNIVVTSSNSQITLDS
jgi:TATA-box binding protein (TBP) (component of TFIID and TFIIIB)